MKNEKEQPVKLPVPSMEQIREWSKRDLEASHYFLGLILRYPEVVEKIANEIYQHAMKTENGAAIDHVKQSEDAGIS